MSWLNFASIIAGAGLGILAVLVPPTAPIVGPIGSALVMAGIPSLGTLWRRARKLPPVSTPGEP